MNRPARASRPPKHSPDGALRLRPLGRGDEAAFRNALQLMAAEGFTFGFRFEPGVDWITYLKSLDARQRGMNLPDGQVPVTFLVAEVAGTSSVGSPSAMN